MKWISLAGALLAACLAVAPAKARDALDILHGTLKAGAQPLVMEDGQTGGCSYWFVAITRDNVYRQGQYLRVTGYLSLLKTRSFLGATDTLAPWSTTLNLVVDEASMGKDGNMHFTPSAPSQLYLLGAGGESRPDKHSEPISTKTPGGLMMAIDADPALKILKEATTSSHAISVAFNQFYGDRMITVPIELDVTTVKPNGERVRSNETELDFSLCMLELVREIPGALKAK